MSPLTCLDICCGGGGASVGLARAGFEVTGVDIVCQKHYPYPFIQADGLTLSLDFLRRFDLVWASWPCQAFSNTQRIWGLEYPDLITPGRALLQAAGVPYIMENVPGAPLHNPILLCGEMFGLATVRHRLFESSLLLFQPVHRPHRGPTTQAGRQRADGEVYMTVAGHFVDVPRARAAMGIDWMTRDELAQAVPPAYAEYLGAQIYRALQERAA